MLSLNPISGRGRAPFGRLSGAYLASNGREYGYEAFWTFYSGVVMWDARLHLHQVPITTFDGTVYLEGDDTPEASIPESVAAAVEDWLRTAQ